MAGLPELSHQIPHTRLRHEAIAVRKQSFRMMITDAILDYGAGD